MESGTPLGESACQLTRDSLVRVVFFPGVLQNSFPVSEDPGLAAVECAQACVDNDGDPACLGFEVKVGRIHTRCNLKSANSTAGSRRSTRHTFFDRRWSCEARVATVRFIHSFFRGGQLNVGLGASCGPHEGRRRGAQFGCTVTFIFISLPDGDVNDPRASKNLMCRAARRELFLLALIFLLSTDTVVGPVRVRTRARRLMPTY